MKYQKKNLEYMFMTSTRINYKVLAEIHPELGEEYYVCKEIPKDVFIKTSLFFDKLIIIIIKKDEVKRKMK